MPPSGSDSNNLFNNYKVSAPAGGTEASVTDSSDEFWGSLVARSPKKTKLA